MISVDFLEICGATAKSVIIRGHVFDESDDAGNATDCVIYCSRKMHRDMMRDYLDGKARYYPQFAGVEMILVEVVEHPGQHHLFDDDFNEFEVKAYDATSYTFEMEHG